jgi:hypothetical protein
MRRLLLLAAAIFISGAGKPESSLTYELRFGATPTSPIAPPVPCAAPTPGHTLCPYIEPDYVPNYEKVVPQAIRSCGASFIRFNALTEGAESAFFGVGSNRAAAAIACIQRQLPQVHVAGPPDACIMPSCMPELIQAPPVPPNLRKPAAPTSTPSHSGH